MRRTGEVKTIVKKRSLRAAPGRAYHRVLARLRDRFGLTLPEAREAWRRLQGLLERSPVPADLVKHPRYSRRAATAAAQERVEGRPRVPRDVYLYEGEDFDDWEFTATYKRED